VRKIFTVLMLLVPATVLAQYTISGKVVTASDRKPVANASVFLNSTTTGAKTADDGSFTLNNVRPGQYDLVVSIVGYETFHQPVMVNKDIALPGIELAVKTIRLKEVRIGPNRNRDNDYAKFKRLFLGVSEFADECKILNPSLLDFDYDPETRIFTATSSDFLIIENKALGYTIKYLLAELTNDGNSGMTYFEGSASFEELRGSHRQQLQWQKNRLKAYNGSSMHFLRSAITNTIEKEGFRVLRLKRKPNPDLSSNQRIKYIETLVTTPLTSKDFVKPTNVKGQFALGFDDCLYVLYDKKKAAGTNEDKLPAATTTPDYLNDPLTTTIIFAEPYAFFDNNGIIINPRSVIFEGNWGRSLTADLLPVDYVPE